MTTQYRIDRIDLIEEWLEEGPRVAPDDLVEAVAIEIPGTPQQEAGGFLRFGWPAMSAAAALVIAAVVGIGLLRPSIGAPEPAPLDALQADLEHGEWTTGEIARDDWVTDLVALGHNPLEVKAHLGPGPLDGVIRYEVRLHDGEVDITAPQFMHYGDVHGYPEGPRIVRSGTFELLDASHLHIDMAGCLVTVGFELDGDALTFNSFDAQRCSHDEKIGLSATLLLTPLTRVAP